MLRKKRLWKSLKLHMDFEEFLERVRSQVKIVTGDLTSPRFGLSESAYKSLVEETESIIHCAASLNRKSAKACFNVNLRGTLEMVKLAQAANGDHGLRRFSDISTVAVAGHRSNEVVTEPKSIEWSRSDYDPYARTKKFCEHMVHELLPDVDVRVFRPSIILGDSRFGDYAIRYGSCLRLVGSIACPPLRWLLESGYRPRQLRGARGWCTYI